MVDDFFFLGPCTAPAGTLKSNMEGAFDLSPARFPVCPESIWCLQQWSLTVQFHGVNKSNVNSLYLRESLKNLLNHTNRDLKLIMEILLNIP